ncbi:MAG TPA: sodium:solute symporter [Fodinibius sp.]|nr:sodium:solute symporter [Fodinibius sp.]
MDTNAALYTIDYVILFGYLAVIVGIGISFSRRVKTGENYFTGSGGIPSWAVGFSILATLISSVTFLAYPGEGFNDNWIRLVQGLMVPLVLIFVIGFIVPLYRKVIGVSTYEFFEKRFGYSARLYTSLAFMFAIFSSMGTVFFLIALTLSQMLGFNTYMVIWVLGLAVILYSMMGGFEAIIWLDVIQGILLITGGVVSVAFLLTLPEMGPFEIIGTAYEQGKISFAPYEWDFTNLTFWVMAINGVFYAIHKYGTDQTVVQRYLASDTDKEAIKASLMGILMSVPVWTLFMFIGTALWSYYTVSPNTLPGDMRPDAVFPHFIMTVLPPGITGILIAGLVAAALSSLDSELNSLSAVCVEDYYLRLRPRSSGRERLFAGKTITFIAGLGAIGIANLYLYAGSDTVLSILFELYAIFSGGIVGLFLLGVLTTRANRRGVYVGIITCILFTAYAFLTSTPISLGGEEQLLLDLGELNYSHHKYMLGVYSHVVLFATGYGASFLFETEKNTRELTVYHWYEKRNES